VAHDPTTGQVRGSGAALPDPAAAARPWLDSYPPGVPRSYAYPAVPVTRFLDDAAEDFPDTTAVHFQGYELTYRALADHVDRFATALLDLGVRKGDRVGLLLPSCPQHVVALLAALRLGAVVIEHATTAAEDELETQLRDAGATVVVCLDPLYGRLARLKGRLPAVAHIIATGLQDALPYARSVLFRVRGRWRGGSHRIPQSEGVLRFTDLIERTPPTVTQTPVMPGDLAALLYTPGRDGTQLGVMLTHGNLLANAFQARLWMPDIQAGRESILGTVPCAEACGLTTVLTGLLSVATLTLLPRAEPELVLKAIDRQATTLLVAPPALYAALLEAPHRKRYDLTSVRASLASGVGLQPDVAARFEALTGGRLREGYGLTEASPLTHANPIYGKAKRGSIGLPVSDTACILVDPHEPTRPARDAGPGALAVAGPQVMRGYWNRPAETAAVLHDGWLHTGVLARMDEDGYFALLEARPSA
jgi:long-chain acyl-CoA synthetase